MSNLAPIREIKSNYPALQMSEEELIKVLENSLYPGAQPASIKMIIGYCKASNLDPMQKPVHIVPIWDSKAKTMRDVVMPGIGLYRSQASRSGEYAGVSEPEFGEDVTNTLDGIKITYPKWCRVTVKRLLPSGSIVEFTAKEFWIENYATKGRDSAAPNSMWTKRPYAQLAKCAEAQALRKAFPEFGAQPTADEMEGKEIDITQNVELLGAQTSSEENLNKEFLSALENAAALGTQALSNKREELIKVNKSHINKIWVAKGESLKSTAKDADSRLIETALSTQEPSLSAEAQAFSDQL